MERQALEHMVRLGEWTAGSRTDESRLRYLAARLKLSFRMENDVSAPRFRPRKQASSGKCSYKRAIHGAC